MTPAEGHLVLRKARERWGPVAIVLLVIFVLPFAVAAVAAAVAGAWAVTVVTAGVVAVPTAAVGAHLRYSRIVVTPDEIAVLGAVVRRRTPRAQAARVVRADLVMPRVPVVDTVFVLDGGGRVLQRIYGHHYRRSDMDRLVAFLGLPASGPQLPVTAGQLDAVHPGLVPWHEAHPERLAAIVVAVTVSVVVVLAVVVSLVLPSPQ